MGFMVRWNGINPNPENVRAILDMEHPKSIREIQRINGWLVTLGRFLSKSAKQFVHFFQTLKKNKGFEWTPKCQEVFEELNKYLLPSPLLSKLGAGDILLLYLGVSHGVISSLRVKRKKGPNVQYIT